MFEDMGRDEIVVQEGRVCLVNHLNCILKEYSACLVYAEEHPNVLSAIRHVDPDNLLDYFVDYSLHFRVSNWLNARWNRGRP